MRKRMKRSDRRLRILKYVVFTGFVSLWLWSCSSSYEGKIVAVELNGELNAYESSSLLVIDPENTGKKKKVLSQDFHSACSPSVDHEGRYLYFQGKQNENDPWQIWMMDLKRGSTTRVIEVSEDCRHPAALPDGSVIFSRKSSVKERTVYDLWRCERDGSGLRRISFDPAINLYPTVLKEGRVLYTSSTQYPEVHTPVWRIMRPDGTKSELYFRASPHLYPGSDGSESDQGYIYFTGNDGQLARVSHKRPLRSLEVLSDLAEGSFSSVVAYGKECLVSYQPADGEAFGLYRFDPETKNPPVLVYQGEKHLTDPVLLTHMPERPRILPSAVNPDNATALLMSQDINHSQEAVHPGITGDTVADRIRVSTLDSELGIIEVKEDGSFYLKLDADIPFRIESLNKQGEIIRGPSDWLYLRPNERRACVGCHADPELAPKNFQPLAVKEDPIVLSAKMKEISQ
jgi:hypothetical protein